MFNHTKIDSSTFQFAPWMQAIRFCPDVVENQDGSYDIPKDSICLKEVANSRFAFKPSPLIIPGTAGTHMKKTLQSLGIRVTQTCNCQWRTNVMDAFGDEWCIINKNHLLPLIRKAAEQITMDDKITIFTLAITTGLIFRLDLNDPLSSIYDYSVYQSMRDRQIKSGGIESSPSPVSKHALIGA